MSHFFFHRFQQMLLGGLVSSLVPNIWGLVSSLVPNIWWQEKEEPCSSDEERAWYRAQNVDEKESEHPPEPKLRRQTDSCGFVFPTPKVRADKPNSTASSSRDPGAVDRQFFENWARELEAEMKKEAEEIAMAEVWAQEIEMEAKKPRSGVPRAFLHGSVPSCVQPAWQQTDAASQSWDGGSGAWHGEWSNHHGSQQSNGEQAWDGAAETWWDDAAGDWSNHHWTETWQQDLPAESWDGHKGDWSDEAWPTTAASEEGASAWHGDWWDSTWEWQDDNEGSQDEAWAKDWSEEIWSEHRNKRVRGHDSPAINGQWYAFFGSRRNFERMVRNKFRKRAGHNRWSWWLHALCKEWKKLGYSHAKNFFKAIGKTSGPLGRILFKIFSYFSEKDLRPLGTLTIDI